MPEYQFNVLCMNDATCDVVMGDMKQEYENSVKKIIDPKKRDGSGDHYVRLDCRDIDEADQKSREMIKRYSNYIRTITVRPL